MISINIDKAKEIKKQAIRAERKPLLESLDVDFVRALEAGDLAKQQEITAKKQALRDATQHSSILDAQSVEDLKQINLNNIIK
jgi:hypothetical protein